MNPIDHLHHLTWVVADLDATLSKLEPWIGMEAILREDLPGRGVRTARVALGDAWLVFVEPTQPGAPATRLEKAGEGLFLLSAAVASLDSCLPTLAERGVLPAGAARAGLAEWRVIDLALDLPGGVTVQLCEERGNRSAYTVPSAGARPPESGWSAAAPNPAPYADDLAYVHSVGFAKPAQNAMPPILERLRSGRIRTARVYDVGCGAGVSTRALVDAGYTVLALEPSHALAAIARSAAPTAHVDERSVHGLEFEPCEAILALGEPLTYHERECDPKRRLQQFFGAAARALPAGGLLIFDLIETGSPALDARSWVSGTDWAVFFETAERPDEQRLTRTIETFRGVNGTYRRSREVHEVATFSSGWVLQALRSAGFEATTATAYGEYALPMRRRAFFAERCA